MALPAKQLVNQLTKMVVISDLHIGIRPDGRSSDFHFNDEEFYQYLQQLIRDGYQIILNGDVFECWETDKTRWKKEFKSLMAAPFHGQTFNDWHEIMGKPRFAAIAAAYPRTVALITAGKGISYINGNHDACCRTNNLIPNAQEFYLAKVAERTIYIAHGHQADHYCNDQNSCLSCLARCATCCCSIMEELIDPDLDKSSTKLAATIGSIHDDGTYSEHARKLAIENNYDAVIYGHTHIQQLLKLSKGMRGNCLYANTGCAGGNDHDCIDETIITADHGTLLITNQKRWLRQQELKIIQRWSMTEDGNCHEEPIAALAFPVAEPKIEQEEGPSSKVIANIVEKSKLRDQHRRHHHHHQHRPHSHNEKQVAETLPSPILPAFSSAVRTDALVIPSEQEQIAVVKQFQQFMNQGK